MQAIDRYYHKLFGKFPQEYLIIIHNRLTCKGFNSGRSLILYTAKILEKPESALFHGQIGIKLADFGFARSVASYKTNNDSSLFRDTRSYAASEVLLHKTYGPAAYYYSLDITLHGVHFGFLPLISSAGSSIFLHQLEK